MIELLPRKTFYRVANIEHGNGLWYDRDGRFTGRIHNEFKFCKNNELPMPFDESVVGWLSAVVTVNELMFWFDHNDISQLQEHGYTIAKYTSNRYREYENHWLMHENHIIDTTIITLSDLDL